MRNNHKTTLILIKKYYFLRRLIEIFFMEKACLKFIFVYINSCLYNYRSIA